jgi:hypothetical protein
MSQFVVHGLLPVIIPGQTNEVSVECESIDDVCQRIRELNTGHGEWRAISIFKIEDWPLVMEGAKPQ